jgi:lipoprotein-releasing system ATP-binding protein
MLIALVRSEGLSALIATHNHDLSRKMDRTLVLDKGALVERPAV